MECHPVELFMKTEHCFKLDFNTAVFKAQSGSGERGFVQILIKIV